MKDGGSVIMTHSIIFHILWNNMELLFLVQKLYANAYISSYKMKMKRLPNNFFGQGIERKQAEVVIKSQAETE